jgi:hypothetical protein
VAALASVLRRSALLAAVSLVLAALGLEAYAAGYPMGMALLAQPRCKGLTAPPCSAAAC